MNARLKAAQVSAYAQVGRETQVAAATPHKLVEMLLDGALMHLLSAEQHIDRANVAEKGRQISLAIAIIEGLQGSLDHKNGGEIAANLDQLYDYSIRTLLQANLHSNSDKVHEVHGLLEQVRDGWTGIADSEETASAGFVPPPVVVEDGDEEAGQQSQLGQIVA